MHTHGRSVDYGNERACEHDSEHRRHRCNYWLLYLQRLQVYGNIKGHTYNTGEHGEHIERCRTGERG
nr:MAG TPA: hypothetical protein [Caudoviricetes sp.]